MSKNWNCSYLVKGNYLDRGRPLSFRWTCCVTGCDQSGITATWDETHFQAARHNAYHSDAELADARNRGTVFKAYPVDGIPD